MNKYIFLIIPILLFTACSKDNVISEAVEELKTAQLEQKAKLNDAAVKELTAVALDEDNNSFIIKLSDGSEVVIPNSAAFILIGEDDNWWIDGINTEQAAIDENGEERKVTISKNGIWQINGKDTGIKLRGDKLKFETEIISITFKNKTLVFTFADRTTIVLDAPLLDIEIPGLSENITVDKMQWLRVRVEVENEEQTDFMWILNEKVIGNTKELMHVFAEAGTYSVTLNASNPQGTLSKTLKVTVKEQTYTNNVTRIFEYSPAPGQFVNDMPKAIESDDAESMRKKAEEALIDGSMISLGGFGGYVVMGFDHTIVNREGADFVVLGNAALNAAEPGIIMVSYDANGNGDPDDKWFEIEGSQHSKEGTIKNYEIIYYKPEKEPTNPDEPNYIRWTDNQDKTEGYLSKNNHHQQPYFPIWQGESITFTGTLLESNMNDQSNDGSNWANPAYEFGYADNWPNTDERAQIDIDWAIDKDGNKVKLKGIDFVKVYTANRAEGGETGEVSTEVSGFTDLNLEE